MMKKTMIIGIMAFIILAATTFSVKAEDQTYILSDDVGDVIDTNSGDVHPEIEDIDIKQVTYTKEDKQVSIEFEFVDDLEESDDLEIAFILITSQDTYIVAYSLGAVEGINSEYSIIDVSIFGFGTNKLVASFELSDDDERYVSLTAYIDQAVGDDLYEDIVSDLEALEVTIGGPTEGKTGENIQFSGSVEGGMEPYYWEWDFNDDGETDSESQNPKFKFTEPGTYNVTVFLFDSLDAWGSNTATITIEAGTGDGDSSSGSSLTMFIVLIAIIVIAGVALLVYFIRK